MTGFVITLAFVAVWLLLGRAMFDTSDWGVHRRRDCGGAVPGPYLPPGAAGGPRPVAAESVPGMD